MLAGLIIFGLLSDSLLSALVGIVGSRRRLGFGWSFIISLLLTPFIGLLAVLVSDPLPPGQKRWGCIANVLVFVTFAIIIAFAVMLLCGVFAFTL